MEICVKTQHYDRLFVEEIVKVDVLKILADVHPEKIEDYAIKLFYLSNKHQFFTCSDAKPYGGDNNERARLVIEGEVYKCYENSAKNWKDEKRSDCNW